MPTDACTSRSRASSWPDARRFPRALQGANPIAQFKAIVSCLTTTSGAATTVNVSTPLVSASSGGDAEIDTSIDLPSPCFAPIVFVTTPGGAWLAVSGR